MATVQPFEVPLTPNGQSFSIDLGGKTYNISITWNWVSACWVADFFDVGNTPVLLGCPLVTGDDLLGQYAYLNFGGGLLVITDAEPDAVPTFGNLGTSSHLYYFTVAA